MIRLSTILMLVGLTTSSMAQLQAVHDSVRSHRNSTSRQHISTATGALSGWGTPVDGALIQPGTGYTPTSSIEGCEWSWRTGPAANITASGATLRATVNLCGSSMVCFFQYGPSTAYGMNTPLLNVSSGDEPVVVEYPLSGLIPDTRYHYRLVAKGISGTVFANDTTFATMGVTPPSVATAGADAISRTGATLHGSVNPRGVGTVYHFEYGLTTGYGYNTTPDAAGSGTSESAVSALIGGLSSGSLYHFRLVAVNSNGISLGADSIFTTLVDPIVTTTEATNITSDGVQLNGSVNPNGMLTTCFFQYGTTEIYGLMTSSVSAGAGNVAVPVQSTVLSLTGETVYHYRLVAISSSGSTYGNDVMFQTTAPPPVLPIVETAGVTNVAPTSAELTGTVNPKGTRTTCYFEYGLTSGYGLRTTEVPAGEGTAAIEVRATATGLNAGSSYHFRLVAANSAGTTYGADSSFTTVPLMPFVRTTSASGVTRNEAMLNGSVNPQGTNTEYHFVYGTTTAYGSSTPIASAGNGTTENAVSAYVNSLTPNTVYHYRLVATSSFGSSGGSDTTFMTLQSVPTVVTMGASQVTKNEAVLEGTVNPNGSSTEYYFEYGPTASYGLRTSIDGAGSGTLPVGEHMTISGLAPGTEYHFRIVATSTGGISTGNDTMFTTKVCEWSGSTVPATNVSTTQVTLRALMNACGINTSCSFEYGLTALYGSMTPVIDIGCTSVDTLVTVVVQGLLPDTVYHYRLLAMKNGEICLGEDVSLRTLMQLPPVVATGGAAWVPDIGALLKGTVNPNGDSTSWYFEYGSTGNYGSATERVSLGPLLRDSAVSAWVSGLTAYASFHYRLVGTNCGGTSYGKDAVLATTGLEDAPGVPNRFTLDQNFPNPFNPSTIIRYGVPRRTHVRLAVYNLLGGLVEELVNEEQAPGYHEVLFRENNLGSGLYIYKLEAGRSVAVKKMLILK